MLWRKEKIYELQLTDFFFTYQSKINIQEINLYCQPYLNQRTYVLKRYVYMEGLI